MASDQQTRTTKDQEVKPEEKEEDPESPIFNEDEEDDGENVIFGGEEDEEEEVEVDESMTYSEEEKEEQESEDDNEESDEDTSTTQGKLEGSGDENSEEDDSDDITPKKVESEINGSIAEKAQKLDDFDGNWTPILREIRTENEVIPDDYPLDKMEKLSAGIRQKLSDKLEKDSEDQDEVSDSVERNAEAMAEEAPEPDKEKEIYNGSKNSSGKFDQETVIKSGPVELVIFKTVRDGEDVYLSGSPSRSYQDQNNEWQDTELLRPRDWPHVREVYRKASDRYGISFPFE